MDDQRFDKLAKSAAEGSLRRRLRKGVLGGITGAIIAGSAVGSAGAQDANPLPAPNNGGSSSFVSGLLAQLGISFGNGGVEVQAGDVSVSTSDDEVEVQAPGLFLRVDDGDVELILS